MKYFNDEFHIGLQYWKKTLHILNSNLCYKKEYNIHLIIYILMMINFFKISTIIQYINKKNNIN